MNNMVQTASDPKIPIGRSRLRIARLLRGGRHGVETDVREEDHAGAGQQTAPAEMPERPSFGGISGT